MNTEPAGVDIEGGRLRQLRKLGGDNLKPFAKRVGISLQYLSQIETGARRSVSPEVFKRICIELGLPRSRWSDLVRASEAA